MQVEVEPRELPGVEEFAPRCRAAAEHVGLAPPRRLVLALDAPEFTGCAWWQIDADGQGYEATLYGSPDDVLEAPQGGWAPRAGLAVAEAPANRALDPLLLDRWLHRNLLQLDDIVRGRVRPREVARSQVAALQACWDVWTDGRLRRWQHPGVSQAERRRLFFRAFARSGLLLPRHWQLFHELWEGALGEDGEEQAGLLRALSQLPPAWARA